MTAIADPIVDHLAGGYDTVPTEVVDSDFCPFCEGNGCEECEEDNLACDWCDGKGCEECNELAQQADDPESSDGWDDEVEEDSQTYLPKPKKEDFTVISFDDIRSVRAFS